ncbi:MAG: trigger factor [Minisyncoccia bacterium]
MNKKIFTIKSKKNLPDCEVEMIAEISAENIASYKDRAFKHLSEKITLPGFRQGHAPEKIIKDKVGELAILEEAVHIAIDDGLVELIVESVPNFLGRPDVSITKLAVGSPIEIKITIVTAPEIKLPDYKKIAEKENAKPIEKIETNEKEVEEAVSQLLKMFAGEVKGDDKNKEPKIPELNEEFVKKIGNFKSVDDFKEKIKENILKEKEQRVGDKRKMSILEAIIEKSEIKMPKVLVENEIDKMQAQFEEDIKKSGLKSEDYLKHIKKSWEDLRKEWFSDAEKRAKLQLVLNKIAIEEKMSPDKEAIEKEAKHLQEHYKDASPERIKAYVEMILVNEQVLKFLENTK